MGPDPFDPASVREHARRVEAELQKQKEEEARSRKRGKRKTKRGGRSQQQQQQPLPLAVGFGLDINVLLGPEGDTVRQALVDARASVVVVAPNSLTREALRDAAHGTLCPLTQGIPGRKLGVARSLFAADLPPPNIVKSRHLNLLCGPGVQPGSLLHVLRRQEAEQGALKLAAKRLRKLRLPVFEMDLDTILGDPQRALTYVSGFLLPTPSYGRDQVTQDGEMWPPVPSISREALDHLDELRLTPEILEDCADALAAARIRLAVDDGSDAASLIADVDGVLAQVEQVRRTKTQLHKQQKKKKKKQRK